MRSLQFLAVAGLLLLAAVLLGRLFQAELPQAPAVARAAFIAAWAALTLLNLWVGVNRAGYTLAEELPIAIGLFLPPAGLACLLVRPA